MKKEISIFMLLLVLLLVSSCSSPISNDQSNSNPYENLLFPEGVEWNMTSDEVRRVMGEEEGPKIDNLSYYPGISYNSFSEGVEEQYYIFKQDFFFTEPKVVEFENHTDLLHITIEVRDAIKYENRTKDRHGNISLEFDRIKEYLSSAYGEPFIDEANENSVLWLKRVFWEVNENTGLKLVLDNETRIGGDVGTITLRYVDIDAVKSPWYEDR